jgi:hypothetical protein
MLYKFFFPLLIASLIWSPPSATAQFLEAGVQKLEVPARAPNFSLKALGGGKMSLKRLRGKVVILTFFPLYVQSAGGNRLLSINWLKRLKARKQLFCLWLLKLKRMSY